MPTRDKPHHLLADMHFALTLLSRLPLPQSGLAHRGAKAAWAWPVAGAVIGALAASVAVFALALGLTPGITAALTLAATALLTGAMHEDGLADTADGLWGGWTRARRLEIMKDSHTGSYGVLALVLVTLVRWSALSTLLEAGGGFAAIIAVACLSRAPMAILMAWLPNARAGGLSQSVGRPGAGTAATALLIGGVVSFGLLGWQTVAVALAVAFVCLALGLIARAKIGGQTGDILGASQQLAEAAALCALAANVA